MRGSTRARTGIKGRGTRERRGGREKRGSDPTISHLDTQQTLSAFPPALGVLLLAAQTSYTQPRSVSCLSDPPRALPARLEPLPSDYSARSPDLVSASPRAQTNDDHHTLPVRAKAQFSDDANSLSSSFPRATSPATCLSTPSGFPSAATERTICRRCWTRVTSGIDALRSLVRKQHSRDLWTSSLDGPDLSTPPARVCSCRRLLASACRRVNSGHVARTPFVPDSGKISLFRLILHCDHHGLRSDSRRSSPADSDSLPVARFNVAVRSPIALEARFDLELAFVDRHDRRIQRSIDCHQASRARQVEALDQGRFQ